MSPAACGRVKRGSGRGVSGGALTMSETFARKAPLARRMLLRAAHAFFLASRGMTLGVRGAAIADGHVWLVRHTYLPGWHLPGGGVEPGQTLLDALSAELAQECGLRFDADAAELHGVLLNRAVTNRDHVAVFVVRSFQHEPTGPSREIAEARLFPLDALPEGTTRGTRARLAEIAAGARPAAIW